MGWANSGITEQVWGNKDNFQVLLYLTDSELAGTHAISNVWEYVNSHVMEIFSGK